MNGRSRKLSCADAQQIDLPEKVYSEVAVIVGILDALLTLAVEIFFWIWSGGKSFKTTPQQMLWMGLFCVVGIAAVIFLVTLR